MLNLEEQIFHQIEKSNYILIIFSSNKEEDSLPSALALFLFLKNLDYKIDIVGNKEKFNKLSFLPSYSNIQENLENLRRFIVSLDISNTKVSQIKYSVDKNKLNFIVSPAQGWFTSKDVSTKTGEFKYDLIITIGVSDLESLNDIYDNQVEFFYKTPIINIDHQSSNEEYGQINFIDINAVANSEIIFYLLKNYKKKYIDKDIATCLLSGIIYKTKNFKTNNLTPRTLLTTSELINLDGKREEIINNLYRSRNISTLKLWGKVLNNLHSENKNKLIWSKISKQDFQEANGSDEGLIEIIDELIVNVPETKLIAIFKEEEKETKLLLYSPKNINVLEMLKDFKPQGTMKIAWAKIKEDFDIACSQTISYLKTNLEKIN